MPFSSDLKFRPLKAEEIEVKIGKVSLTEGTEGSVNLILHKTARVDMKLLDETVGPGNWRRLHRDVVCGERIRTYCNIEIFYAGVGWVGKEDVGEAPDFSLYPDKTAVSDSFKRAGFCWGIGRELYTIPDIKVKTTDLNLVFSSASSDFPTCNDDLAVTEIVTIDGIVKAFSLKNKTTKKYLVCFDNRNQKEKDDTGGELQTTKLIEEAMSKKNQTPPVTPLPDRDGNAKKTNSKPTASTSNIPAKEAIAVAFSMCADCGPGKGYTLKEIINKSPATLALLYNETKSLELKNAISTLGKVNAKVCTALSYQGIAV